MKTWYFLLYILYVMGISNEVSSKLPCRKKHCQSKSPDSHLTCDENLEWSKICEMHIVTTINNRYSTTKVTRRVVSMVDTTEAYYFSHLIPNNAFVTGFEIDINGENYTSFIIDDKEARNQYASHTNNGSSESQESASARDTQKFSISVNMEGNSRTTFYLTYEELLKRKRGRYEYVLNIYPGQLVEDFQVEVYLHETSRIINLEVPNLRTGNDIGNENEDLDPQAFISEDDHSGVVKSAKVLFTLSETEQQSFASVMKTNIKYGFAGQFVVQYDVENHKKFGEIMVNDGYFVNFFAPKGLDPLTKHVVFVLDTSGSMQGQRIQQLKEAMKKMLKRLRKKDLISLVEFNSHIKVWDLVNLKKSVSFSAGEHLKKTVFPEPGRATSENIKNAEKCVDEFKAAGDTDILTALKVGLRLVELGREMDDIDRQPLMMFLTDGDPTFGEKSHERIIEKVSRLNWGLKKASLSTLAFGNDADKDFLKQLAILNSGLFKHIYHADDSELQIEDFYDTISVPVLSNVNFQYDLSIVNHISQTEFPVCYEGSELVVVGKYDLASSFKPPVIEALGAKGPFDEEPLQAQNSSTDISRIWAFVTVKQLLNDIKVKGNNSEKMNERILNVSSRYSFVTPYSSMVIVKPNDKMVVLGTSELTGQST